MSSSAGEIEAAEVQVDIEQIMREIRLEILGTQDLFQNVPGLIEIFERGRFHPDLYDHLYQAGIAADISDISLYLTPSRIPAVGRLWQPARRGLHKIALAYTRRLASEQSAVNLQLLSALVDLVKELETSLKVEDVPNTVSSE